MTLALDGSGTKLQASAASTFTIALTTANANDLVFVAIQGPSSASTSYSISAGSNLTSIAQRGSDIVASTNRFAVFKAVAPNAFSGNITVTINGWGGFGTFGGIAFGVSGANTSSPFDASTSLPATTSSAAAPTGSTQSAVDFVFACVNCTTGITNGSGWTQIATAAADIVAEYQITSSNGSFTGNVSNNSTIISSQLDAVVAASGVTLTPTFFDTQFYSTDTVQAIGW